MAPDYDGQVGRIIHHVHHLVSGENTLVFVYFLISRSFNLIMVKVDNAYENRKLSDITLYKIIDVITFYLPMIYLFWNTKYERNNKKPVPEGMFEW